jgi:hypothetical protein
MSIITINVKLVRGLYAKGPWEATIALESSSTLEHLHAIIQQAVDFDNDHLYTFYVARTERSRDRIEYDEELFTRTLDSLFPLPKGRRLYYWFDFGDDWMFQISRTRHKPFEPGPGAEYPQLLSERGTRPDQYPSLDDEL